MRMCAPGAELPIACAQAGLGLPPEVLERLGERLQAAVQVSAHWGGVARRPGPCDQGLTGLGMAGRRETSLASALAAGRCRRRQAQVMPEWARVLTAGPVPACGEERDRPRPRHATENLERVHAGREPPGVDVCVAVLCPPMAPCGGCGHRPHLVLTDEVRRGGGTDDRAEPAPVRGAPGGPAGLPDRMPSPQGVEAQRGRLQRVARLCTRPAQVTHGGIVDGGDIDRGEIP